MNRIGKSDPWVFLQTFTRARIALGRAGGSLPTQALLSFQLAHARARDAVHQELDVPLLSGEIGALGYDVLALRTAAADRSSFIRRPDLGRTLHEDSTQLLQPGTQPWDVVFIAADGLSALATQRHAVPLLQEIAPALAGSGWNMAPVCIVRQGRVAIGDEIGAQLNARLAVVLIGERPGLSSPDSLGIYLTYGPRPGRSNAERNCLSNVRPEGLSYPEAARKLFYLMTQARQRQLSGVTLKEAAPPPTIPAEAANTPAALPPAERA